MCGANTYNKHLPSDTQTQTDRQMNKPNIQTPTKTWWLLQRNTDLFRCRKSVHMIDLHLQHIVCHSWGANSGHTKQTTQETSDAPHDCLHVWVPSYQIILIIVSLWWPWFDLSRSWGHIWEYTTRSQRIYKLSLLTSYSCFNHTEHRISCYFCAPFYNLCLTISAKIVLKYYFVFCVKFKTDFVVLR